jgi:hypothetical protein
MNMQSVATCLALLASLAAAGCTARGVPDAARPGVMGSGHTNPADPGAPNGGSK